MKKLKWLFIAVGGFVALVLLAAILLPLFFKDAIAARVRTEINQRVNATVNFSGFGLSLLTSFPDLTLSVEDLSVVGVDEFAGQPLASMKSFNLTLNLWDVIGGTKTTITSVTLDQPNVSVIVLKNGKANYDIAKPTPASAPSSPSSFSLALKSYAIKAGRVSYDDRSSGLKMSLENLNHHGRGDFTSDLFTLVTNTTIDKANVSYGGVKYLNDVRTALDSNLQMDLPHMKFTAKDSLLTLNEMGLGVDGWVAMPGKDIDVDLTWNVKKNDFKNFMSLVPGVYREGFRDVKASGVLAMNGFLKGTYTATRIPGFGLTLSVKGGSLQYPSLPSAVTNTNIDLTMTNPDGVPDHTVVDLKQLHAELGGQPIDARLHLATPVSDPQIDAMAKGTVDLDKVKTYIPLDKGSDLSGVVTADVTMKGRYASVANKQLDQMQAGGTLSLTNVRYTGEGAPATLVKSMLLTFHPTNATLNSFEATVGKSQLSASGSLDNLPAYYFKNEMLKGRVTLNSSLIDLNEFMTAPQAAGTQPASSALPPAQTGVLALPANVDLAAQASIGKLLYENLTLENVKGAVTLKDQVLDMTGLTFTMLNGAVTMTRWRVNPARPQFAYNMSVGNLDIQQTAKTFDSVRTLVPIAERAKGTFATELNVTGQMDEKNQPIYNTINGHGKITTAGVSIANFEPLNKIADALHMGDFKDIPIQRTVIQFAIKNGRVAVDPFETTLQGASARISGSSGLDQSLDYLVNLAIPRSKISGAALGALTGLMGKVSTLTGGAVQLPDPFKVDLKIGGTVPKPTVSLALAAGGGGAAGSLADQAKDKVQDAVKGKLQDLLKDKAPDKAQDLTDPAKDKEKAQAEAAKLLADAQAQAQQIRDAAKTSADAVKKEGYDAADKLVAQAKNPLTKAVAQRTAAQMRKETDQKAQKIIDDGNASANAIVDAAKKKGGGTLPLRPTSSPW